MAAIVATRIYIYIYREREREYGGTYVYPEIVVLDAAATFAASEQAERVLNIPKFGSEFIEGRASRTTL
jgi:hypothetical protein